RLRGNRPGLGRTRHRLLHRVRPRVRRQHPQRELGEATVMSATAVEDEVLLKVDDLHVSFRTAGGAVRAVRGLDLELRRGEIVGIVGESGSGKSTASLALLGLLPDNASVDGDAYLHGVDLTRLSRAELDAQRGNRIAMIYQDPMTAL